MKYKINNLIIDGSSPVEAMKICKLLDVNPEYAIWVKKNGKWLIWGGTNSTNVDRQAYLDKGYEDVKVVKNGEDVHDSTTKDSIKDEMFEGYIIDKELGWYVVYDKHYSEDFGRYKTLEEAKQAIKSGFRDSIINDDEKKYQYWFCPDDFYGQHGSDYYPVMLTREEAEKVENTRILKGKRGFLTESLTSMSYYVNDSIKDERLNSEKIAAIQANARNIGGHLASVVVDVDIDDKGRYISKMYISTVGTWLETPAEADNYLHQLQSAIEYFKTNYKYKAK